MTSTQLHAGYTAPASAAQKGASPLEKITAMLEGCGIKILPVAGYPKAVLEQGENGKNIYLYHAVARGRGEQIAALFDTAFPQHSGALKTHSNPSSGNTWIYLQYPAWQ